MKKIALITGIFGQDAAYLAEYLLDLGYEVHGLARSFSSNNNWRLKYLGIDHDIEIYHGDITDHSCIMELVSAVMPDEIYNLAAQSSVGASKDDPYNTMKVNIMGCLNILEAIKKVQNLKKIKMFQAGSSEIEDYEGAYRPENIYGVSKLSAYFSVKMYRRDYNIFACNGILFGHESPLRDLRFVSRKISHGVAAISCGVRAAIEVGNIRIKREFGFAGDYVKAMHGMLQLDEPRDFEIGVGKAHSIKEFIEEAFRVVNINIEWGKESGFPAGYNKGTGERVIETKEELFRVNDDEESLTPYTKYAKEALGWEATTKFNELVKMMVEDDVRRIKSAS